MVVYDEPNSPTVRGSPEQRELSLASGSRQRGFYSELIDSQQATSPMRAHAHAKKPAHKQKAPPAKLFSGKGVKPADPAAETAIADEAAAAPSAETTLMPEPKVHVPFKQELGALPRRVVVERQRRIYSEQDLDMLLMSHGIDLSLAEPENALPVASFDDTEYDPRHVSEWASLVGETLLGRYLHRAEVHASGCWRRCMVLEYDSETELFTVLALSPEDAPEAEKEMPPVPHQVPRIELCFDAENPVNFAARVAAAHSFRALAMVGLKYELLVDCMPAGEMAQIEKTQMQRIMTLATRSKVAKVSASEQEIRNDIVVEVQVQHARAIASMVLRGLHESSLESGDPRAATIFSGFALPPSPPLRPVRWSALWDDVPTHKCLEPGHGFHLQTILTTNEVVKALIKVRSECNKVLELGLFALELSKAVSNEEFEQIQATHLGQVTPFLREHWPASLKNTIRTCFKDITKGWFNIKETREDVYKESKMKRFFRMVALMMQDAVIFMAESSLNAFANLIVERCEHQVRVSSPAEVSVISPPASCGLGLFTLEIVVTETGLSYRVPPSEYKEVVLAVFSRGVSATLGIAQVERYVMDSLFWSDTPVLQTVNLAEGLVPELQARCSAALDKALIPAVEYLAKFATYEEYVTFDEEAFRAKYEADERPIAEMVPEVKHHLKLAREMEEVIPHRMFLGLFSVSCMAVRKVLVERHRSLAAIIIKRMSSAPMATSKQIMASFGDIMRNLNKPMNTIEDVAEIEEYVNNLGSELDDLRQQLQAMVQEQEVIDQFEVLMSDTDFKVFYATLAMPRRVDEQIAVVHAKVTEKREEFAVEMQSEQEAFGKGLERLEKVILGFDKHKSFDKVKDVAAEVRKIQAELKDAEEKRALFNKREVIFGQPQTDYSQLSKAAKAFEPFAGLWLTSDKWIESKKEWFSGAFNKMDPEVMETDLAAAQRTLYKLSKTFESTQGLADIVAMVRAEVDEFMPNMPLITALRNPGMRTRHWEQLTEQLGKDMIQAASDSFTLTDMLELKLEEQTELVTKVCDVAGKEYAIEQAMDKMEKEWQGVILDVIPYRESGTFVLKGVDVIQQVLDDQIVMTQSMAFSPFKGPFAGRIDEWEKTLTLISDVVEEWIKVQRAWMYLEPIFSSDDIMRQLPTEGKRFANVDRTWRKLMAAASNESDVIAYAKTPRLLPQFQDANQMLELVQKGLAEYLETKRVAFSRFYFLSNDELLEILSQSRDPLAVQPHLKKCYEAINKLTFESDLAMTAMISGEGEVVPFTKKLYPKGGVEYWMSDVMSEMKASVRQSIIESTADYKETARTEWVLKWPGQTLIAVSQIYWTLEVDHALREGGNEALHKYFPKVYDQLLALTKIVSGKVTKLQRKALGALITIDVHARDVTQSLRDNKVSQVTDFAWIAQLRYALQDGSDSSKIGVPGDCLVKQLDGVFGYGNEYLGCSMRLVVTPLTDRIYLTLTGALQLYLGGAPAGPAGTGKTETTKDLAKALAKQCVVFNCGPELDYLAMGKFLKGLAMSGAWACFDEFNRIDLEVLSVVAQQVSSIQQAAMTGQKRFVFEGAEIGLDPACAVFITMNPGYAGRSELPDNLKALFRPVACMVPDYALIAEIRLYSFGYTDARRLSQKMVKTFQLASEQVSSQDHYDFGMRAVNTVIQAAGNNRAANPGGVEDLLVLSALADSNRPKFLAEDMILFNAILGDLFPGFEVPTPDYTDLLEVIRDECAKCCIIPTEFFLAKCIQIYEVSVLRHGFMTVGPAGGGKTLAKHVLLEAQHRLDPAHNPEHGNASYKTTKQYVLNPKSVTMGQLYGQFDENTHEWTDGIIPILYRAAVNESAEHDSTDKQWIVFDGPVDALWIESMNTVLDDNKKICLSSGEIIAMSPYMTMMFEVEDLAVASPATVSRVGTIFMEPEKVVGTEAQIDGWLLALPPTIKPHGETLGELLKKLLPSVLSFVRKRAKEYVPTVDNNLVTSTLNILSTFWTHFVAIEGRYEVPEELSAALPKLLEKLVVFSVIWGAGASTDAASRAAFDVYLRERLTELQIDNIVGLPKDALVYDVSVVLKDKKWVGWMETIPAFTLSPKVAFEDIIVPTLDSVRYMWVLEQLVKHERHVLAVGPTGTGKTLNIINKLMTGMPDNYGPVFVGFSAQTSANMTQDQIDAKIDKRRKGIYGPPSGKKYIIFVDDVNMPQREEYGAQPPIEILRQWMGHGGWYERKTWEFRKIIDVSFIGAMGPPGGGRQIVSNRFLRYFNFIAFPELEDASMKTIFTLILKTFVGANLPEPLLEICGPMIDASIKLYNTLLKELLPTPTKPHYTFNMRDLAAVVQGVLYADTKTVLEPADFCRIWAHENLRVFRDRLVNDDDRAWFDGVLKGLVPEVLGNDVSWDDVVKVEMSHLLYGDFMVPGAETRIYGEITDTSKMVAVVEECLEDYNATHTKKMPLVMFIDAVGHVARISRVIRQPRGNALLLGVGGSGRQSLTRLAAAMAESDCFQIEITKSYGKNEWRDDLKKALLKTGEEGKSLVFLFTDTQIVKESFLEDINNLLNSGDVPNLFDDNDVNSITASMRPICQALNLPLTKVALYSHFIKRVRSNIHMCLCMSPGNEVFNSRLRNFPSLVNNCTIDFFAEWPEEALKSVAFSALESTDLRDDATKNGIVAMCGKIHQSVEHASARYLEEQRRYNYVTPTSYLEVLSTFKTLLALKREEVSTAKRRLVVGLEKLQSTEVEVAQLEQELIAMQPVLKKTSEEVSAMMVVIENDKAEAAKTREVVVAEEQIAATKAEQCQEIKDSAERDLAEALPALDAAVAVLRNLKLSDLSEVAKYANPPAGVKLVMEAMCVLREIKPAMVGAAGQKEADYWVPGKKMLQDAKGLLDAMFAFDKDNIPDKVVKNMMPYMNNPDFEPEKIAAVSKACTAMCQWARAMIKYHFVAKEVEPKRIALKESQDELDELTQKLNKLREKLRGVEEKIAELEAKFTESVAKKEELAAKVADAEIKQDRAGRLLGGLGGEKIRWNETVKSLTQQEANLIGDVCIAAGAVAYLGPFTSEYRISCTDGWRKALGDLNVAHTQGCTVLMVMADPVVVRQWRVDGLPADTVSTENGIILSNARRWPLCIDPQGQANKWIKSMESANAVETCKPSDKEFLRTLENAVRFGKPVVMENILESLDPSLEPILLKQTFKQGGAIVMKIGDNVIPYHPDFKFYLTSKLPNPHYAPEQSVKLTILNFTVTMEGLEDQLLGITVAKERPDLDELKNSLVISGAKMAAQLKEIESSILRLLSESEGNILDDESLINTLSQSKVTSDEINAKAEEAAKTEVMIDETREKYRPVAFRASLLFFCVADMGNVDPMYQYSMPWFINLFVKAIEDSDKSHDIAERLRILGEYFTYLLYENICRSLFEAHKLLFSFIVTIKILQGDGKVNADEWRFFLSGSSGSKVDAANPDPTWITSAVWGAITSLACLPAFEGLETKFRNDLHEWRAYFDSSETHEEKLPSSLAYVLDPLQTLCVLRSVRPDKVVPGMQNYVKNYIGQRFIEPPHLNLGVSFKDASNIMPIVFVISPGSDPYADLLKLATEMKMNKKLQAISLGQGQGPIAERAMSAAMEKGTWILLQNCHLAASWMPKLEAIVEQYDPNLMHRDYRLWLTSLPSPKFPVSILQNSVKMTIEPPRGIKMNMKGSYNNFSDTYLDSHPKSPQFKKLLYGLCFFHALLQDRRKFGALGFNIRYEFTAGDLKCCILQLETYLAKYDEVPYQVLVNLFGHINYGGRITDDWDRRCVLTTLMSIVNEGIMSDDFMLAPGNECYQSPPTSTVGDYMERIVNFPLNPHPNVFGLHANADITCAQNETQELCDIMLSLQPKVSSGAGKSREEIIGEVTSGLQARHLKPFNLDDITSRYPLSYEQSMNTVLSQECIRYNKLIRMYNKSLSDLSKALKGLIVMSAELEAMATALFSNQVPTMWSKVAYPSLKPLAAWVDDLVERISFLQNWNDGGPPPTYWISGFFFPQAFLTGTLQNYARKYKVAIDTVSFAFHVKSQPPQDVASGPEDGCFVHGFFLEGAIWDAESCLLSEARPKELYSQFPMIWLKPEQDRAAPTEGVYACPAYKTTSRAGTLSTTGHSTNFVLMVELPSDKPCSGLFHKYAETYSAHWIQRAVALFTTLAY